MRVGELICWCYFVALVKDPVRMDCLPIVQIVRTIVIPMSKISTVTTTAATQLLT